MTKIKVFIGRIYISTIFNGKHALKENFYKSIHLKVHHLNHQFCEHFYKTIATKP